MLRALFAVVLFAALTGAQDFRLAPAPRSLKPGRGELTLSSPVVIQAASTEDHAAAETLIEELKAIHGLKASLGAGPGAVIRIMRAGAPEADREIRRLGLAGEALDNEEGYVLSVTPSGALVAGRTAAGVYYGVQTLRQLIGPGGRAPAVTIADWPALRYRGLSVDISRGPILTEEQIKALIRAAGEYKLNMLSFYMEHVFSYRHAPLAAPEGGEFTPELARRLSAYARRHQVELAPQQQTFGHLHHMLKFELYADMAEIPYGSVLSPESERTYQWIRQAAAQLAASFPSRFLHIGSDETFELGEGRARARAERDGVGEVYVAHMERVGRMLAPLNRKLMFWGDIALRHAGLIPKLPRNLVAMTWVYNPMDDFSPYIKPFRDAGFEFFVCPGLNNWNRIYPNVSDALGNIQNFVRDGKRMGAAGMFNTHWADDGEALFNLNWYAIVFSAAAAWQPGEVELAAFHRAFDWVFYRHQDGDFADVIRRLDRIHGLLRAARVGDASNRLFWLDVFSEPGSAIAARIRPSASEIRRIAEEALVDLEASRTKARCRRQTLDFLRLAARRLDYLGMKVQFGARIAELYRDALNHQADAARVGRNLSRINSTNGLLQDLRDYANQIKALYRAAWLTENRPYWLDNVLARYDAEVLYWVEKSRQITAAAQQYSASKKLPEPEKLGMYLP